MDASGLALVFLLTVGSAVTLHNTITTETPGQLNPTQPYQSHINQTQFNPTQPNQTQLLTQDWLRIHGTSEIPGLHATVSTRADVQSPEGTPNTHLPPQTVQTTNFQTAPAPINSTPYRPISSAGTSATAPNSGTRNPTIPPTTPPVMIHSTQNQSRGMSPTSLAPPSSQPRIPTSASTSSIMSHRTPAGPSASSAQTSASSKTTPAGPRPKPRPSPRSRQNAQHGKVVAGVIGGALAVMILGFLLIYVKKRRLQKRQITTTDWAGPSPFLVGGSDSDQVTLRSSNRISLSSFLPQRLSKRLSLLPEVDEELQDMSPGGKPQGSTFGQGGDAKDEKHTNGSPAAPPPQDVKDGKETNWSAAAASPTTNSNEAEATMENSA